MIRPWLMPRSSRWKDGERPVSGPTWVALRELLRTAGEAELAQRIDARIGLPV